MYALGVYSALVTEEITRGHRTAGAGTLRFNGTIGSVDGIRLKVRAAEEAGAEYFVAPLDDAPAARAAAQDIKIVPVGSFRETLNALRQLGVAERNNQPTVPASGDTTLARMGIAELP